MARTAILYIAERCNQSCVFCLEEDGAWTPFVDPSTTAVMGEVDRLWGRGARHITFMGGETFFRKDLGKILAHARTVGFTRVGVTTNGTVLSKKGFLTELVSSGLSFIELSIHGHTAELANTIGGTHFTFERQRDALAELDEIGNLFTIVNVVVCRENRRQLLDIARYVCEGHPRIPVRFKFKFVSLQGLAAEQAAREGDALRYEDVDPLPVADYLAARDVPFWFYNFPLCRLGTHARRAHEVSTLAVDERYFDLEHRGAPEYYDSGHQLEGRVWPAATCAPCALRPLCPGIEESHRRVLGAGALSTRLDQPLEVLAFALSDRGADPDTAAARLEALRDEPRPDRFVRQRSDGAIRFVHPDEPEPLDLCVEEGTEGKAFAYTSRFALSYRRWSEMEPTQSPRVASILERAVVALRAADTGGASLLAVRSAVARTTGDGWKVESATPAPRRRGALPVLPPIAAGPRGAPD